MKYLEIQPHDEIEDMKVEDSNTRYCNIMLSEDGNVFISTKLLSVLGIRSPYIQPSYKLGRENFFRVFHIEIYEELQRVLHYPCRDSRMVAVRVRNSKILSLLEGLQVDKTVIGQVLEARLRVVES